MKIEDVLFDIVEEKIGVTRKEILSKSRQSGIVDARRIFAVILLRNSNLILTRVGEAVKRDHATIIFYNKNHDILVKTDQFFRSKFESLTSSHD